MRTTKGNENCIPLLLFFQKFILFFVCYFTSVLSQCETGFEPTCVWVHDEKTALRWKMGKDGQEPFVELTDCQKPCGNGIILSPWLPRLDKEISTTIHYKIYGTSSVFIRLNMHFEDTVAPHEIFYKTGNYAYAYPKEWQSKTLKLPTTHTRYKLVLKAYLPYREAMVAVKGITLDGSSYLTSTSSTSSSTTTKTSSSHPPKAVSTSTTSTTTTTTSTTTTVNPEIEEEEISPTQYGADIEEFSTSITETADTAENIDYFRDDDEDDEDDANEGERRFQALEVEDFIGEEDLMYGYTKVIEPELCMYK